MNAETQQKRRELSKFIHQIVEPDLAIQGIIVIGSVAKGIARSDSDIDAVVFLDPYDLYAVPAESKWESETGIFQGISRHAPNALQLDFKRVSLVEWSKPDFTWSDTLCAELSEGWLAYDRHNEIGPLVSQRTKYTDENRQERLDGGLIMLDWLIKPSTADRTWETLGPTVAHSRLHSAFDYLVQALFAYNRRWRTLPSRELTDLLALDWLPEEFEENLLQAANALSADFEGYQQRLAVLNRFFNGLILRCQQDGLYGADPISEAFIRQNSEPGRDWNMDEWNRLNQEWGN